MRALNGRCTIWAVILLVLLIQLIPGCSDDDKVTNSGATEYYTELYLTRFYPSQGGVLFINDTISASFDSVYSPLTPSKPCSPVDVSCNSFALHWDDLVTRHIYAPDLGGAGILNLGSTYIFSADSGQAVPAFEKPIRFPSVQPLLSYPKVYDPPMGVDSVSTTNGFTITWGGTSSGSIELIISDGSEVCFHPSDTLFYVVTEHDGSYEMSPADLANIPVGELYQIMLTLKNSEAIISEGYDPRSHVTALTYTISHFFAL